MGDALPGGPFTVPPWTVVSEERSGWGAGERAPREAWALAAHLPQSVIGLDDS